MGLGIYILPSDMNLNIRSGTVGYNNKILVSNSGFSLGKNEMVNMPEKSSNKTTIVHSLKKSSHMTRGVHSLKAVHTSVSMHEDERTALVLAIANAFGIWYAFRKCEVLDKATPLRWPLKVELTSFSSEA